MTSAYQYRQVKALDDMAAAHGFRVVTGYGMPDSLSLMAADDALPIYAKDMPLVSGDAEYLIAFLQGWQQSRSYTDMLKLTNGDKVTKAETEHVQRIRRAQEYGQRRKVLKTLRESA